MERSPQPEEPDAAPLADPGEADVVGPLLPFVNALPFYVLVVDEDHQVLAANDAVLQTLGKTPDEAVGCYCPNAVHGMDAPYPGCPLEEAVERGGAVEKEFYDEEQQLWLESMIYPVAGATRAGRRIYLHFVRDISLRKRMEQELRTLTNELEGQVERRTADLSRANEQLAERTRQAELLKAEHEQIAITRERLARVGELSSGIAHTIRNPLHGLVNSVNRLKRRLKDDDDAQQTLDWMHEGLTRMETVTRRLLTLTREAPLRRRTVDLNAMVGELLLFVQERSRESGVRLKHELTPVPMAQLDADRLAEALINLLDNAIDACGGQGLVTVHTRASGGARPTLHLEVHDTGHGIPEQLIDRVLDPFFTTKSIGEGTGLGLAITKRAVDEHNGAVTIRSVEGKGTVVRIDLPIEAPDQA